MKAITYYPQNTNGKEELASMVASLHAETVANRISKLDWPADEKKRLFDAVISIQNVFCTMSET